MTSWVPEECTLPTVEQPGRAREFYDLVAASSVERPAAGHLRLGLAPTPEVAARVAALAVREASCCLFFTFTLVADGDGLRLDIAVPPERAGVLDAIAAQAES
jgi:hypothetical protein